MQTAEYIQTPALKTLVDAGAVSQLSARGVPGGFVLVAKVGMSERVVRAQKQTAARIFATLDGLANYCAAAGVHRIHVDLTGHSKEKGLI